MNIFVTGATGLVGRELVDALEKQGHAVWRLTRQMPRTANDIPWDPRTGLVYKETFATADAVVHLAGENIASGRWTPELKQEIRESRIRSTETLVRQLIALPNPPKTLICASAIGFYGDRGAEELTEAAQAGTGFLSDVCREWEAATAPAVEKGIRVVNLRIGVVLSSKGGALAQMLTPFKLGVGGNLGDGKQFMSWVSVDDLVGVIQFVLAKPEISGPVNAVAGAVTNADFTRGLGRALGRPVVFPMPAFAARLAFGEMADALLLASTRVKADKLAAAGFKFRFAQIDAALQHLLN